MRKKGATYREIENKLGISRWSCITYLKNIEINKSWVEEEWKKAEKEAENILLEMGYNTIINLNEISPSPYWDYYCSKDNEKWLIDVTINQNKNLIDKSLRQVEGYRHAVLLKTSDKWKMLEIKTEEILVR